MAIVNDTALADKELVIAACGNSWVEFSETIPPVHVETHENGIAIILEAFPDSLLPTQIIELVVDEQLDAQMRSVALRHVIYQNISELINKMGVVLNKDYLEIHHLPLLYQIAEFMFRVTEIEDSFQTVMPQLLASDTHPKYRFINALAKVIFDEEEPDISELEYIIDDVSEVTLKDLCDSIAQVDNQDIPPENIIDRVVAAREALDGSLGFQHVRNGGGLGSPIDSYMNFFNPELSALLGAESLESFVEYGKHVISLYLISEINDDKLKEALLAFFDGRIDDVSALIQIESMIKSLKLPSANQA